MEVLVEPGWCPGTMEELCVGLGPRFKSSQVKSKSKQVAGGLWLLCKCRSLSAGVQVEQVPLCKSPECQCQVCLDFVQVPRVGPGCGRDVCCAVLP